MSLALPAAPAKALVFGREPAAIVSLVEAALTLAVVLWLHWSDTQVGLVMAAVTAAFGVYTAWVTQNTLLGVVVGLLKALFALAIGFGLRLDPHTTAAVISLAVVLLGLFNRSQTSPVIAAPLPVPAPAPVAPPQA